MSVIECINPFNNPVKHYFLRRLPDSKYWSRGDVAKLCPICYFEAHKRNNPIAAYRPMKNIKTDAKPESDSL